MGVCLQKAIILMPDRGVARVCEVIDYCIMLWRQFDFAATVRQRVEVILIIILDATNPLFGPLASYDFDVVLPIGG